MKLEKYKNKNVAIDIKEATQKYQILGVGFNASKDEIRRARNKLIHHFHPDKYPYGWVFDGTDPEKRVYLIQEAYLYIVENYEDIMEAFQVLTTSALSNQMPAQTRSHWAYTTIATFNQED